MNDEHAVEVAQLEYPANPRFADDEPQVALVQPDPLEGADQDAEPERIDIVDPREVEDEMVTAGLHLADHVLAQLGRADDVELTGDGEHRPLAGAVGVYHDVHRIDRTGRHACDSVTGVP